MKKAYFAISYANKEAFAKEIKSLTELLLKYGIELLVFVDTYNFRADQEKEMMQVAFREIDSVDFLIAELSTKSIGVGIEIGYAFAKKKPIFYLRKKGTEYATTASGSASVSIEYKDESELISKMKLALSSFI